MHRFGGLLRGDIRPACRQGSHHPLIAGSGTPVPRPGSGRTTRPRQRVARNVPQCGLRDQGGCRAHPESAISGRYRAGDAGIDGPRVPVVTRIGNGQGRGAPEAMAPGRMAGGTRTGAAEEETPVPAVAGTGGWSEPFRVSRAVPGLFAFRPAPLSPWAGRRHWDRPSATSAVPRPWPGG